MPRFMLEGPRLSTIFCFLFIHYAGISQQIEPFKICSVRSKQLLCFVPG